MVSRTNGEHAVATGDRRRLETDFDSDGVPVGGPIEPFERLGSVLDGLQDAFASCRLRVLVCLGDDVGEGEGLARLRIVPQETIETSVRVENLTRVGVVDGDAIGGLLEDLVVRIALDAPSLALIARLNLTKCTSRPGRKAASAILVWRISRTRLDVCSSQHQPGSETVKSSYV